MAKVLAVGFWIVLVACLLFWPSLYAVAWVGDETGWYHVEDYMCDAATAQECDKYIAERKMLRARTKAAEDKR
jgi:hypothetical protein